MIFTLILIIHILACLILISAVLIQQGKGASMGAAFGTAGSQTVFGSSGAGNFLTKLTALCAGIFFSTSLILAYKGSFRRSVVDSLPASSQPASQPAPGSKPGEKLVAPAAAQKAPAAPAPAMPVVPAAPAKK
ncbi:MAG: preprotein translocase subunit SecG [Deltaproteobacteria bacterium]